MFLLQIECPSNYVFDYALSKCMPCFESQDSYNFDRLIQWYYPFADYQTGTIDIVGINGLSYFSTYSAYCLDSSSSDTDSLYSLYFGQIQFTEQFAENAQLYPLVEVGIANYNLAHNKTVEFEIFVDRVYKDRFEYRILCRQGYYREETSYSYLAYQRQNKYLKSFEFNV